MGTPGQATPPATLNWMAVAAPWWVAAGIVLLAVGMILRDLHRPFAALGDLGALLVGVGSMWQLIGGTFRDARGGARVGYLLQGLAGLGFLAYRVIQSAIPLFGG